MLTVNPRPLLLSTNTMVQFFKDVSSIYFAFFITIILHCCLWPLCLGIFLSLGRILDQRELGIK